MKIKKEEVKKELRALGMKIYKKKDSEETFVKKGDIKKVLASLAKKDK